MNFASDNAYGVDPRIMDAILAANTGPVASYGGDSWTQETVLSLRDVFGCPLTAYLVPSGTAANALALSTMVPAHGAVLCHENAHILVDECGATTQFSGGAAMIGVASPAAKLTPQALKEQLKRFQRGHHDPKPAALSLTQASELGTVYTPDELIALSSIARENGMYVHMDGARFANALAHLRCTPADISWKAGVDVLCFGATKNGAMAAEAIVFFNEQLADDFDRQLLRGGQSLSKGRFLGAQMSAYLKDGLWLENALRANGMAARLAEGLSSVKGVRLPLPVEANLVFPFVSETLHAHLQKQGAIYHPWPPHGLGVPPAQTGERLIRLVTSFQTSKTDVDHFVETAKALPA